MRNEASQLYLIFDMDGTLIDSNPTHKEAYIQFFKRYQIDISDDDFKQYISGRINPEIMTHFFERKGEQLDKQRIDELIHEKETLFQALYTARIEPIKGLHPFLMAAKAAELPMALATSAPQMNVDFVFEKLGIRSFFRAVVVDKDVPKGKPDPTVFEVAANRLGASADQCLVFEDSARGVEAAKKAQMAVVALTTSHEPEATEKADRVIADYTQIQVDQLRGLLGR